MKNIFKKYKKAKEDMNKTENQNLVKCSTLQYFENEIGIGCQEIHEESKKVQTNDLTMQQSEKCSHKKEKPEPPDDLTALCCPHGKAIILRA